MVCCGGKICAETAGAYSGLSVIRSIQRKNHSNGGSNGGGLRQPVYRALCADAGFFRGDAGEYLWERARKGVRFDAVLMDPARAGADKQFLRALNAIRPERVVYISCDPVSLARDLRFLSRNYDIMDIQPFDMFPFTRHVECVVSMSRKEE